MPKDTLLMFEVNIISALKPEVLADNVRHQEDWGRWGKVKSRRCTQGTKLSSVIFLV